ncbi:cystathionine beta-lyase, chloroplastic isoform X1 [Neltuma alba]|uniref:cystathionine beta-lyase, chloroplastic isoform X1 n=1 Tax=Neltuma alba TaxID=207710 RepID=UPI0010A2E86F|nr:cystathionine beta-lyase, chloroplastic-like isoform X1 [Prosopis alba]XP_028775739.1 cystathionine beta-lyase, chloroplastic-like isoform X1 [Prosopis alba]XP_028775812.1 cystathionine beta-lyase, chloroplastic-like isoform X1 [Prosopis alba]XP_028775881.1 cystathionine beta-lyase, chloroplastic-like isoform X1 [Prosopis alba]
MASASVFLKPFVTQVAIDLQAKSTTAGNMWESLGFYESANLKSNRLICAKGFRLSCSLDREMAVGASALVDSIAECSKEQSCEPGLSTVLMNFDNEFDPYEAVSTPIYQTATFKQPSATENGPYDYTRSGNPTRDALERLLAKLDKADRAFCFGSGMAALSAVCQLFKSGDEIVAGDDIYGGSDRLLSRVIPKSGVVVKRVNTSDLEEVASVIGPWTKLVWLESPTNPRLQISDIRKIAEMAHAHGALVLVDNSIMSPVLCQPLELGADIVMHSATKFIGGHSYLMAGVIAVKGESLAKEMYFLQNAVGSGLAPFECWLCLQGMKTMELRVEKQQVPYETLSYWSILSSLRNV